MNIEMLKYLCDLVGNKVSAIQVDKFFTKYPRTKQVEDDLEQLKAMGYINSFNADNDQFYSIIVNQIAIDYFFK